MRKIEDILIDASEGNIPSHEECYYTLLALRAKLHFLYSDLQKIAEAYEKQNVKLLKLNIHLRAGSEEKVIADRMAFKRQDPLTWLGESGIPFSPENKRWRNMADVILKKVEEKYGKLK